MSVESDRSDIIWGRFKPNSVVARLESPVPIPDEIVYAQTKVPRLAQSVTVGLAKPIEVAELSGGADVRLLNSNYNVIVGSSRFSVPMSGYFSTQYISCINGYRKRRGLVNFISDWIYVKWKARQYRNEIMRDVSRIISES